MYYKFTITQPGINTPSNILILANSEQEARKALGNYPEGTTITCKALERTGKTGSLSAASHVQGYPFKNRGRKVD